MTDSKTCGQCYNFFRCVQESSDILNVVRGDDKLEKYDYKSMSDIPACPEFKENV